jgi:hypothetical protein
MYKSSGRFFQAKAFRGRTLSGYPEWRKLESKQGPSSSQSQFQAGTAYITEISPLIHYFLNNRLSQSDIVDELQRIGIATPSGNPWSATLAAELIGAIQLNDKKLVKRPRRAKLDPKRRR